MNSQQPGHDDFDALMRYALQTAPVPEIPANFAQMLSQQVSDYEERAGLEIWLTRAPLLLAIMMLIAFSLPWLTTASEQVTTLLNNVPWPLLLTTAIILAAIKLLDFKRLPTSWQAH